MAQVAYIHTIPVLSWVSESHITNPPQSPTSVFCFLPNRDTLSPELPITIVTKALTHAFPSLLLPPHVALPGVICPPLPLFGKYKS